MFKDIIIGQYVPCESAVHSLDVKIKIVLTIIYIVTLFLIDNIIGYVCFIAITFLIIMLSRINIRYFIKGLRPMMFIAIFTAAINLFMTPGDAVFKFFILSVSRQGIAAAITMFLRLVLLVTGTSVLTLTTSPLMLTDGIEKLLSPLKLIKIPSQEIAMMMTIAIRFIPTLAEETEKIQKAQAARGADFSTGNFIKRVKSMIPILVPLFVSAFKRADDLSVAMESRCYGMNTKRTRMNESKICSKDVFKGILTLLVFAAVVVIDRI